ncbi:hypothetical protein Vretifemale_4855 [Volvox reticuliferus]|nr:hypothetical protein Vretifemale_4855 [Volvox reticuliferus]
MRDIRASAVIGHAYGRRLSIFRYGCGSQSGNGLPRHWLQTRARRTWNSASDDVDKEADSEGGGDSDGPMSLAALSRAESQRKRGQVAQQQQRRRQPGAPNFRSQPFAPQTGKSEHSDFTMHTNRLGGFEPVSPSPNSSQLCAPSPAMAPVAHPQQTPSTGNPSATTPVASVAKAAAGSAVPSAALRRGSEPENPSIPNPDPEPAPSAPEPRHPPVAFRNVADLRRMLQERQAVAEPAEAVVGTRVNGAVAAATASPAPLLPRRFFVPIPMASNDLSPVPSPDNTANPELSLSSSEESSRGNLGKDRNTNSSKGIEVVTVAPKHVGLVATAATAAGAAEAAVSTRLRPGIQQATANDSGGGFTAGRPEVIPNQRQRGGDGKPTSALDALAATATTTAAAAVHPPGAAPAGSPLGRVAPLAGLAAKPKTEQNEEYEEYEKAKRYALSLLQRSPLPTSELSRRLLARGHPRQAVEALLTQLAEGGALNDRLYARLYAASKWNSKLMAPSKIKQELLEHGISRTDVAAALTHVFGPSQRIQLTGTGTPEELAVREALLDAARRHVERRRGAAVPDIEQVSDIRSTSRSNTPPTSAEVDDGRHSSSSESDSREKNSRKHSSVGVGRWWSPAEAWDARMREQNAKR